MKKRFLSVLLCVCMVLTLTPTMAFADTRTTPGIQVSLLDVQAAGTNDHCSLSRYAGKCQLFYDRAQEKNDPYSDYPFVVNVPYKENGTRLQNVTITIGGYGKFSGFDWADTLDALKQKQITKNIGTYNERTGTWTDAINTQWGEPLSKENTPMTENSDDNTNKFTTTTVTIPDIERTVKYVDGSKLTTSDTPETPKIYFRFIKKISDGQRAYYGQIQFRMLPDETADLQIHGIKVTNNTFDECVEAVLGPNSGDGHSGNYEDTLKYYCFVPNTTNWLNQSTTLPTQMVGNYIIDCSDNVTSAGVGPDGWTFVKPRWGKVFKINDANLTKEDRYYRCELSIHTSGGYKKHALFAELYVIPVDYCETRVTGKTTITDEDIDTKLTETQHNALINTLNRTSIDYIGENTSYYDGSTITGLSAYTKYIVEHSTRDDILSMGLSNERLDVTNEQTTTIKQLDTDKKSITFDISSTSSWNSNVLSSDKQDLDDSDITTVSNLELKPSDEFNFQLKIPNTSWNTTLTDYVYTRSGEEAGWTKSRVDAANTITDVNTLTNITIKTTDCTAALDTLYYDTLQDAVDNLKITPEIQNLTVDRVPESPATVNTISKINLKLTNSSDAENTYNPSSFLVGGEGIILKEDVDTSKLINKDGWTYNFVEGQNNEPADTISIETEGKGSVTVDNPKAEAGETVTITATPDEGYEVGAVTVTGSDDSNIEVKNEGDNTYTFTMPEDTAQPVTVTVTFKESEQQNTAPNFVDVVANTWYSDAVNYVVEKGLMEGTSATTFEPNTTTTRGMVVTILHRLEGSPSATAARFSDVPSGQWYSDAVAWAASNGIVTGYDNGNFGPNDMITREQMATILYRYAGTKGYNTSLTTSLTAYVDASAISPYANTAMSWATATGLIKGTSGNTLSPAGDASRAEVATILMRFCENVAK